MTKTVPILLLSLSAVALGVFLIYRDSIPQDQTGRANPEVESGSTDTGRRAQRPDAAPKRSDAGSGSADAVAQQDDERHTGPLADRMKSDHMRLGDWPVRGNVEIVTWALSDDGTKIAALNSRGELDIWDVDEREVTSRTTLEFPGGAKARQVDGMYWLPDGERVLLTRDFDLGVWSIDEPDMDWKGGWSRHPSSEEFTDDLSSLDDPGLLVLLHPDDDIVFSAVQLDKLPSVKSRDADAGFSAWDANTGKEVWSTRSVPPTLDKMNATFSPQDDRVVVPHINHRVRSYTQPLDGFVGVSATSIDLKKGHTETIAPLEGTKQEEYFENQRVLMTDGEVVAGWNPRDADPSNAWLLEAQGTVGLYDSERKAPIYRSAPLFDTVSDEQFAPLDAPDEAWAPKYRGVELSENGEHIHIFAQDRLLVIDTDERELVEERTVQPEEEPLQADGESAKDVLPLERLLSEVRLSGDGRRLAGDFQQSRSTGRGDDIVVPLEDHVEVWKREDGQRLGRTNLRETPHPVEYLAFAKDGGRLVARDQMGEFFVGDVTTSKLIQRIPRSAYGYSSERLPRQDDIDATHPFLLDDEHLLIVGPFVDQFRRGFSGFDPDTGREVWRETDLFDRGICDERGSPLVDVALSPDARQLVMSCPPYIQGIDVGTYEKEWTFDLEEFDLESAYPSVAYSEDGEFVVFYEGDSNREIESFWLDAESGELQNEDGMSRALQVSPSATHLLTPDRTLVSSDGDKVLDDVGKPARLTESYLLAVEDDRLVARHLDEPEETAWTRKLDMEPAEPTVIALSPDRSVVAVGTDDGHIELFAVELE